MRLYPSLVPSRPASLQAHGLIDFTAGLMASCVFADGQTTDAGTPDKVNPIQMMLMFEAGEMTIADIPAPAWLLITKVVLPFARFLGYQAFYSEYF